MPEPRNDRARERAQADDRIREASESLAEMLRTIERFSKPKEKQPPEKPLIWESPDGVEIPMVRPLA